MDFLGYVQMVYNTSSDVYFEEYCAAPGLFNDYAQWLYNEGGRADADAYWAYMNQHIGTFVLGFDDYYSPWLQETVPSQYWGQFEGCPDVDYYIDNYLWESSWHDGWVLVDYAEEYVGGLYRQYEQMAQATATPAPTTPGQPVEPTDMPNITGGAVVTPGAVVLAQTDMSFAQLTGVLVFCLALIAGMLLAKSIFERF